MVMPKRNKKESKTDYARRMHWAGKGHVYIARNLKWTQNQVQRAIFKKKK